MKIPVVIIGILCACLLAGCNKPAAPAQSTADGAAVSETSRPPGESPAGTPSRHEKVCFACNGSGTIKCLAPGCVDGKVECPGPCLRLTRGAWVHLAVAGHPPTDVWQKFYQADGSYTAYNQGHLGHVIVMQNGRAVDTGPCKICGGSGRVDCPVCQGTGRETCPICGGRKYVPDSWTPTDNPWLNRQPDLIRLTNGQIMFGKIASTVGTDLTIKTRDGRWLHVSAAEVMPKTESVTTNAAALQ